MESKDTNLPQEGALGYETRDLHARGVLIAGVALLLFCWAVTAGVRCFFGTLESRAEGGDPARHVLAEERERPAGPRLQADPPADRRRHQARIEAALHAYAWLDPGAGRVSLPVERALELVLEEGLPDFPATDLGAESPGEDR